MEISNWVEELKHVRGIDNPVADTLSRPSGPELPQEEHEMTHTGEKPSKTGVLLEAAALTRSATEAQVLNWETVDHKQLAKSQETCPMVEQHRAGNHVKGLNLVDVEFSPGVYIYCDLSTNKKARPLVPEAHRATIVNMFHQVSHPGIKETTRKIAERYYWPRMKQDIGKAFKTTICH